MRQMMIVHYTIGEAHAGTKTWLCGMCEHDYDTTRSTGVLCIDVEFGIPRTGRNQGWLRSATRKPSRETHDAWKIKRLVLREPPLESVCGWVTRRWPGSRGRCSWAARESVTLYATALTRRCIGGAVYERRQKLDGADKRHHCTRLRVRG
jgi:hypothetical protein